MSGSNRELDPSFIEKQRQRLLRLQASLSAAARGTEQDESSLLGGNRDGSPEPEEDAQRLDQLDTDDSLVTRDYQRLEQVDRALKKIAAGTYGLSDEDGKPISRERLEAVPEALLTLEQEQALEQRAKGATPRPPRR